jgi:hypothetical protein
MRGSIVHLALLQVSHHLSSFVAGAIHGPNARRLAHMQE